MRTKVRNFTTFEQWNHVDVKTKLGVVDQTQERGQRQWLTVVPTLPEKWLPYIDLLRMQLYNKHSYWNETELLGHFIIPFLDTIEWGNDYYSLFNDRPLKAVVKGYTVSGVVDGIVASGVFEPHEPYFFLHEYKKMKGTDADPLGQLLIAMLAARELNQDDQPMYGCYIIGRYWTFVLLEGDTYCQSQGYDASDEGEIQIIWSILHQTKLYVEERVQASLTKQQL
jgi:hypothetical protein